MPQFFIPPIGQQVRLLADWRFRLHHEHRNAGLIEALLGEHHRFEPVDPAPGWAWGRDAERFHPARVCLVSGTVLKVERIYVRKGQEGFDSVTFRVVDSPDPRLARGVVRFWAKLEDVNGAEVEFVQGVARAPGAARKPRDPAARARSRGGVLFLDETDFPR